MMWGAGDHWVGRWTRCRRPLALAAVRRPGPDALIDRTDPPSPSLWLGRGSQKSLNQVDAESLETPEMERSGTVRDMGAGPAGGRGEGSVRWEAQGGPCLPVSRGMGWGSPVQERTAADAHEDKVGAPQYPGCPLPTGLTGG